MYEVHRHFMYEHTHAHFMDIIYTESMDEVNTWMDSHPVNLSGVHCAHQTVSVFLWSTRL